MTSLVIERFAAADSARRARALDVAHRRAVDALEGRTVWCVAAAPAGTHVAGAVESSLRAVRDDGVSSRRTPVRVGESLARLIERLDAMLRSSDRSAAALGPEAHEVYARGIEDGDELIGTDVHAGDVVVLHDPLAAALAEPVRSRDAHAVWRVTPRPGWGAATQAWRFLQRGRPCFDAYITDWRRGGMAAFISALDVLSAKEGPAAGAGQEGHGALSMTSLLADIVRDDRGETVGGRKHPRPTVAPR